MFFIGNLQLFTLASLLLNGLGSDRQNAQEILVSCMVGSSLVVFMFVVLYHCYKLHFSTKMKKFFTWQKHVTLQRQDLPINTITETCSSAPTTSVIDLKELLLEHDSNQDLHQE